MGGEKSANPAAEKLIGFVARRMKEGATKEAIIEELIGLGAGRKDARTTVNALFDQLLAVVAAKEVLTFRQLLFGLLAAGGAATVAAAVLTALFFYVSPHMALLNFLMGVIVGGAVSAATGRRRGPRLQLIGALAGFFGLALSKAALVVLYSLKSPPAGPLVWFVIHPADFLNLVLVIIIPWRMLKGTGIKLARPLSGEKLKGGEDKK